MSFQLPQISTVSIVYRFSLYNYHSYKKFWQHCNILTLYMRKLRCRETDLPYVAQEINSKHVSRMQVSHPLFCFSFCFLTLPSFPSYPLLAPLQFLYKPGSFVHTQFYWSLLSSTQLCHLCSSVSSSIVVFTWLSWSNLWTLIACVTSLLQTLLSFLCIYSFYCLSFHSAIMSYWRLPGIIAVQQ